MLSPSRSFSVYYDVGLGGSRQLLSATIFAPNSGGNLTVQWADIPDYTLMLRTDKGTQAQAVSWSLCRRQPEAHFKL